MADRVGKPQQIVRASDERAADAPMPAAVNLGRRRSARSPSSPYSHKFRLITALLAGVAIGAVLISVAVLASGSSHAPGAQWSAWSPPDNGTLGAREIADHLAPFYRISPVDQLDVVTVVNLSSPTAATSATGAASGLQVAVRLPSSPNQVSLLSGNTIAYNLCGIGGSSCAIGIGAPSPNRLLLLQREALELALYTFKYISGTQNVVTILPPGHTVSAGTLTSTPNAKPKSTALDIALLFSKDELKPWLDQPLSATFQLPVPPMVPELAAWKQTTEAGLVAQITERGLFQEHLVQAQDGSNLIVLDPLPPQ